LGSQASRWLTATNLLIAINVAVFLTMVVSGISWIDPDIDDLMRWGADYGPDSLSGQYWRIVTCSFVHIGILHLALNMWCLWSLGRLLERLLGAFTTFTAYLVTAVGASLLSLSWNPMRVSAGASGAIFGIAGVLIPVLYYGKLNLAPEGVRKLLGYVVRFSLINLIYGLRAHVDNMAHLGGLVTGLVAGLFLARSFSLPEEERGAQRRMIMAGAAMVVALFVIPVVKAKSYVVEWQKGQSAMGQQDYNSAIEHLKKYAAAQPEDAYGHANLGRALHNAHRYDEAVQEYEKALQLEPDFPVVQVNLAKIYSYQNQPQKAVALFRAGMKGITPSADTYYSYARALKATGNLAEAEKAIRQAIRLDNKDTDAQSLLTEILKMEAEQQKKDVKLPSRKESASGPAASR
jgi:membrane associated rhomboid family serine protease/Flp pilus assembly protein TadD